MTVDFCLVRNIGENDTLGLIRLKMLHAGYGDRDVQSDMLRCSGEVERSKLEITRGSCSLASLNAHRERAV
jgi:hypothetical protein